MTERYMRLLDHVLTPVLIMLAIFLLLRGHNNPGGGFIAGLMVSTALQLQIMSRGEPFVRARIGRYLHPTIGVGLLLAASAASIGLFYGGFFKGVWWTIPLGPLSFDFGTPVAFDIGVFLVVISTVVSYLLGLNAKEEGGGTLTGLLQNGESRALLGKRGGEAASFSQNVFRQRMAITHYSEKAYIEGASMNANACYAAVGIHMPLTRHFAKVQS